MRRIRHGVVAAFLAVAAVLVASAATDPPQNETSAARFGDTARVDIVNIWVRVTDRGGSPVDGLRATNFELLVDGEPVPIVNFLATSAAGGSPADGRDQPVSDGVVEPSSTAVDLGRYLVIFVDNRGGRPLIRDKALSELAAQLPAYLADGRRIMLASQNGAIRILHGFADDPDELAEALNELASTTVGGSPLAAERADLLDAMDRTSLSYGVDFVSETAVRALEAEARALLQRTRTYSENVLNDQRERLAMLTRFQASLAGLPGDKTLLYIGEGFDTRPGEVLFRIWEQKYPDLGEEMFFSADLESGRYRIEEELADLATQANTSGVSCYTLYTAGSERFSSLSAKSSGAAGASNIATSGRRAIEDSLSYLASATGGLALSPGGDLSMAIERLPDELVRNYSLGFQPITSDDPATHRVEVIIRREGLRVRHRESYRFKTVDERMSELTYAALLFEPGPNPLEATLSLAGVEAGDQDLFEVAVEITVPMAKLALVPSRGTHGGQVKAFFAVKDERGWASPIRVQSFPVLIPNTSLSTALGEMGTFSWKMMARDGPHELAVTVRDGIADDSSTIVLEFKVPTPKR
jgi:VWFA-related protein